MAKKAPHRLYLTEEQIPTAWYNLRADMKEKPEPMLNPATGKPVSEEDLYPVFCKELAHQEMDNDTQYIEIPPEVLEMYKNYRPSPLCRAYNLEKALDTPAKIYYKFEGNNTSGSHKLNSAIPTETGAGQWGTALSEACCYFGLPLEVFMVKASYNQKPFRKAIMQTFGASVVASPSNTTNAGRAILADNPDNPGSLGCAISEAVERAVSGDNVKYVLGSVLNQVLLHQSIVGLESAKAMELLDEYPGCAGGGSNLGGLIAPFAKDKLQGKANPRLVAIEPASCPSLTRGRYAYDFCDTGKITPMAKMYTLGCTFTPSPIHAGGLRYHGMAPILSKLYHDGYMEAKAVVQTNVFEAATLFAKYESILPAPESAHAILGAIEEAKRCKEEGRSETILFGLTGTGFFDMLAYENYQAGNLNDYIPTDEDLAVSMDRLPKIPGIQE